MKEISIGTEENGEGTKDSMDWKKGDSKYGRDKRKIKQTCSGKQKEQSGEEKKGQIFGSFYLYHNGQVLQITIDTQ